MTPDTDIAILRGPSQTAQRVAAMRQRRAEAGLTRLELYVHPDDHAAVKAMAKALSDQRQCKSDRAKTQSKPIQS